MKVTQLIASRESPLDQIELELLKISDGNDSMAPGLATLPSPKRRQRPDLVRPSDNIQVEVQMTDEYNFRGLDQQPPTPKKLRTRRRRPSVEDRMTSIPEMKGGRATKTSKYGKNSSSKTAKKNPIPIEMKQACGKVKKSRRILVGELVTVESRSDDSDLETTYGE